MPADLKTFGDHIRKRRLALKLRQKDVAARIGVATPRVRVEPPGADETLVWRQSACSSETNDISSARHVPGAVRWGWAGRVSGRIGVLPAISRWVGLDNVWGS